MTGPARFWIRCPKADVRSSANGATHQAPVLAKLKPLSEKVALYCFELRSQGQSWIDLDVRKLAVAGILREFLRTYP